MRCPPPPPSLPCSPRQPTPRRAPHCLLDTRPFCVFRAQTDAQVKRAYMHMVRHAHPDKGGDADDFQEIQLAFDTLSDASKRARHDFALQKRQAEANWRRRSGGPPPVSPGPREGA